MKRNPFVETGDGIIEKYFGESYEQIASIYQNLQALLGIEASVDDFRSKYLGSFAEAPVIDGNGDPISEGALYFQTGANPGFHVWDGAQWRAADAALTAAEAAQTAAETAETNAETAATNAASSASGAAASELAAEGAQAAAEAAETNAAASASAAANSEAEAKGARDEILQNYGYVFNSVNSLLADTLMTYTAGQAGTVVPGDLVVLRDTGDIMEVKASGASDENITTSGGVKLNYRDGAQKVFTSAPKKVAIDRSAADSMSSDLSAMSGYAAEAATTGGGSGTIYWVTHGGDSVAYYTEGSLRWAVEQVRSAGSGRVVFDPRRKIDVVLVAEIELPANITVDAPGRNATVWRPGDVNGFEVLNDNCVIRRLKFGSLTASTATERDGLWIRPDLADGIWVDECSFENCSDGCIDVTAAGTLSANSRVTISRCQFRNHDKTMLMGALGASSSATQRLFVTVLECNFDHVGQRNPKVAQQTFAHVVNCYYTVLQVTGDDGAPGAAYGVWASEGGEALVEDCWFTAAVGSGFNAAYADLDGNIKISNCFASDSMSLTETDPTDVTVPPYSLTKLSATAGQAGRFAMQEHVTALSGSQVCGAAEGVWVFDADSTEEPNGVFVRSLGGTVAGRWVRQDNPTFNGVPSDEGLIQTEDTGVISFPYGLAVPRNGTRAISSGAVTLNNSFHTVAPESGNADDLTTITFAGGATDGQRVVLMNSSSGNTITLKHGTGNIELTGGTDVSIAGGNGEAVELMWAAFRSRWVQLKGPIGPAGIDGAGIPSNGGTGQVLTKLSGASFDTSWTDVATVTDYNLATDAKVWVGGAGSATEVALASVNIKHVRVGRMIFVQGSLTLGAALTTDASQEIWIDLPGIPSAAYTSPIGDILVRDISAALPDRTGPEYNNKFFARFRNHQGTLWQWMMGLAAPVVALGSESKSFVAGDIIELNLMIVDASAASSAPVISGSPTISGSAVVGQTLTASEAAASGSPAPVTSWQWKKDGLVIVDATNASYLITEADDGSTLTVVQTSTNTAGNDTSESAATAAVTYAAPTSAAGLADQVFNNNTGVQTFDPTGDFTVAGDVDLSGVTWSLPGALAGVTINSATGLISFDTDALAQQSGTPIVVRATNSGGFADSGFSLSITNNVVANITITGIGPQAANGNVPVSYTISQDDATVEAVLFLAADPDPVASDFNTGAATGYIDIGQVALTTAGSGITLTGPDGLQGNYKLALLPTGGGNADVVVSASFALDSTVVASFSATNTANPVFVNTGGAGGNATFAAQNIGTEAADREVYVGVALRRGSAPSLDGVTIGGVSASLVGSQAVGTQTIAAWYKLAVPTGTTADIVVQITGSNYTNVTMAVFDVKGRTTEAHAQGTAATKPVSANVNTQNGGAVLAAVCSGTSSGGTITPTGFAANNTQAGDNGSDYVIGSATGLTAETPRTMSADHSGSATGGMSMAVAAIS
jgi:pectate lyase